MPECDRNQIGDWIINAEKNELKQINNESTNAELENRRAEWDEWKDGRAYVKVVLRVCIYLKKNVHSF